MAVMITIHDILKPIAEWYGGGTEGNRSDLDIIVDVVSDLQKDRAQVLVQTKRIKELEENGYIRHKHNCNMGEYNSILRGKGCTCGLSKALKGGKNNGRT